MIFCTLSAKLLQMTTLTCLCVVRGWEKIHPAHLFYLSCVCVCAGSPCNRLAIAHGGFSVVPTNWHLDWAVGTWDGDCGGSIGGVLPGRETFARFFRFQWRVSYRYSWTVDDIEWFRGILSWLTSSKYTKWLLYVSSLRKRAFEMDGACISWKSGQSILILLIWVKHEEYFWKIHQIKKDNQPNHLFCS